MAGCNAKGVWSGAFIQNRRCSPPRITARTEGCCLLFINKRVVQEGELGAPGAGRTPEPAQAWVRSAGQLAGCSAPSTG